MNPDLDLGPGLRNPDSTILDSKDNVRNDENDIKIPVPTCGREWDGILRGRPLQSASSLLLARIRESGRSSLLSGSQRRRGETAYFKRPQATFSAFSTHSIISFYNLETMRMKIYGTYMQI